MLIFLMVKKLPAKSTPGSDRISDCLTDMGSSDPIHTVLASLPLDASFYSRPTLEVAQALLGQHLVLESPASGTIISRIVETEAYTQDDPACHAYNRRGGRSETLYKQPGLSYVYFIYGMYFCLNAVTEPVDRAGAVLIRAVEPVYNSHGAVILPTLKTHGPGRLCKALSITKERHNEQDLTHTASPIRIHPGPTIAPEIITTTTRIGIQQAADYPWRFYITDNPFVSVKVKH